MAPAPKIPKPTLTSLYIASCCRDNFTVRMTYKHQALEALLAHIEKCHPDFMRRLEKNGRMGARSQNGSGYFDSAHVDGWSKAQPAFRRTHILDALEQELRKQEAFD